MLISNTLSTDKDWNVGVLKESRELGGNKLAQFELLLPSVSSDALWPEVCVQLKVFPLYYSLYILLGWSVGGGIVGGQKRLGEGGGRVSGR